MRFWDSSAIVPLLIAQAASARAAAWLAQDAVVALWTLTPVEIASALWRLVREEALDERDARRAESRMDQMLRAGHLVTDVDPVKILATRLLRLHPLRAFDALQLAAALHWAEGRPEGRMLHTLDTRLARAAEREGFLVPA
jgi:predicted nucleic acid-binding protein